MCAATLNGLSCVLPRMCRRCSAVGGSSCVSDIAGRVCTRFRRGSEGRACLYMLVGFNGSLDLIGQVRLRTRGFRISATSLSALLWLLRWRLRCPPGSFRSVPELCRIEFGSRLRTLVSELLRFGFEVCVASKCPWLQHGSGRAGARGRPSLHHTRPRRDHERNVHQQHPNQTSPSSSANQVGGKSASAGNRTRVTSMATMYSTTRPLMLLRVGPGGYCRARCFGRGLLRGQFRHAQALGWLLLCWLRPSALQEWLGCVFRSHCSGRVHDR